MSDSRDSSQELPDDELGDAPEGDGATSGIGKQAKGVRGQGKCNWALDNKKESVDLSPFGRVVSDNCGHFSRYLGILVRDGNLLPINPLKWEKVEASTKVDVWDNIRGTIEFRPEQQSSIHVFKRTTMMNVEKLWRNFKADLKKAFYKPFLGKSRRWECGDSRVHTDQWRLLVQHWDLEHTAIIAAKNAENRSKQTLSHTSGTKSFAHCKAEYSKTYGEEPDPITFFQEKHTRRDEDRSWVNLAASQTYGAMQDKLKECIEGECPDTLETRQKVYVEVMGPETGNRVRGEGLGVAPYQVPWVQKKGGSSNRSRGYDYDRLESQHLELQEKYKRDQDQMQEQLRCNQVELEELKKIIMSRPSPVQQPLYQPSTHPFGMPFYPPHMFPHMPYQPQTVDPTGGLTGLLKGDGCPIETDFLESDHGTQGLD